MKNVDFWTKNIEFQISYIYIISMALGYCAVWQVKFYATKSFFHGMDVKIYNIWYVGSTLELQMSPQYNYNISLIIM